MRHTRGVLLSVSLITRSLLSFYQPFFASFPFVLKGKDDDVEDEMLPPPPPPPAEELLPPVFLEPLKPQEVRQGNTLKLECRASQLPSVELQWFKDDVPLVMDARVQTVIKNNKCFLIVSDVKTQDEGEYKLVICNKNGKCECSVAVLVNEAIKAPRYVEALTPLDVNEGEDVQLIVTVTGEPEMEWYRDDKLIEDDGRFVIVDALGGDDVDSFTLAIEQCRLSDAGVYKCVSRNAVGETTCSASLNVIPKPLSPREVPKPLEMPQLMSEPGEL